MGGMEARKREKERRGGTERRNRGENKRLYKVHTRNVIRTASSIVFDHVASSSFLVPLVAPTPRDDLAVIMRVAISVRVPDHSFAVSVFEAAVFAFFSFIRCARAKIV